MTIGEYLTSLLNNQRTERLQKLKELSAPAVLIESAEKMLAKGTKGIGHFKQFSGLSFTSVEEGKGRRGRTYYRFSTNKGDIIYALNKWGTHNLFISTK